MTLPAVCFIDDVCTALRLSRRTAERLLRHGAFPIPELPRLDRKHRWSGAAVQQFLEAGANPSIHLIRHARSVRQPRGTRNTKSLVEVGR